MKTYNFNVTREDVQKAIASETARLQDSHPKEHHELLGANWFACAGCKAGLNTTLAAAIAAAIIAFPEDTPVIATIATACGISEAAVTTIIAGLSGGGAAGIEEAISELCKTMGACS